MKFQKFLKVSSRWKGRRDRSVQVEKEENPFGGIQITKMLKLFKAWYLFVQSIYIKLVGSSSNLKSSRYWIGLPFWSTMIGHGSQGVCMPKLNAEATIGIWSTFRIKHYISTKIGNRDQTKKNFGYNLHEIIGNCCTEQCYLLAK